ncbi:bactericidal permeability-increasing protein [Cololabis saira]|uniref:bactericidal permeability-increasing protein n=1 Tax=Cololabis saira TaxID=129043 RepID=UPI002AD4CDDF|nr:bactericidal permeability-increasing protein [Cololabis saira]XP_061592538.1 bactericidal permeability-increasing protein [Cololabis saira]
MLRSLLAAWTLLSCTGAQNNPAVQVILTNKGLEYGKHVGAGWVQERLQSVTFPDISGEITLIHYTVTGTTITKCDFPEPSVEFLQDPAGVKTSVSGLSVALAGDWSTSLGIIHDSGSFEMAIFSLDVTSVVQLGRDGNGRLSVTSLSCDAEVGDVDIQFHGGASWIFQPFADYFKGHIIEKIRCQTCSAVNEYISILEDHLQTMDVSFAVDQVLTLELPLTGLPVTDASNLKLGLKGEFYTKNHTEPPFVAQPFMMSEQPKFMLSLGVSEFTLNSASYSYFSAGILQAVVNDSMVFKTLHIHLNTTSMGKFIPQLPKMFPDLPMSLVVYAREAPLFSIQPGSIKVPVQAAVKALAIETNGTQVPLFKLNADVTFSGKMWIADGSLKGSMTLDNFTLTLVSSEVGEFKIDGLESVMRTAIKTMFLFKVNEILGKGTMLPRMKHAQLVNSVLKMEKGFIAVSSDAEILQTERSFN